MSNYDVNIDAQRDPDNTPSLFTNIKIQFLFEGENLDESEIKKIKRAVDLSMTKYCSVTKIMEKTAEITYESVVNGVII